MVLWLGSRLRISFRMFVLAGLGRGGGAADNERHSAAASLGERRFRLGRSLPWVRGSLLDMVNNA